MSTTCTSWLQKIENIAEMKHSSVNFWVALICTIVCTCYQLISMISPFLLIPFCIYELFGIVTLSKTT